MDKQQNNKTKGMRARKAENQLTALQMRQQGMSYREIGTELDVVGSTAYRYVWDQIKELKELSESEAEFVKELELSRLDIALESIWIKVEEGDLAAIDRLLRIQERRSKYLALDAPAKSDISIKTPKDNKIVVEYIGVDNEEK